MGVDRELVGTQYSLWHIPLTWWWGQRQARGWHFQSTATYEFKLQPFFRMLFYSFWHPQGQFTSALPSLTDPSQVHVMTPPGKSLPSSLSDQGAFNRTRAEICRDLLWPPMHPWLESFSGPPCAWDSRWPGQPGCIQDHLSPLEFIPTPNTNWGETRETLRLLKVVYEVCVDK